MNIIFGRERAADLATKYTVLELDTIRIGVGGPELVAFCVIENLPIMDMPKLTSMKDLHQNLIIEYRKRNWNYCVQAMEHLMGFWNHELDTFYTNLLERITDHINCEPDDNWDGVVVKQIS